MAVLELELPLMLKLDVARMREIRDAKDLTQTQAAARAGMSLGRWNDIESGRRANVTIDTLGIIAAALGCDARDLLTPAPKLKRKG
ncbi:MAG TPA: helix-turn-helix transcriptional regulator [Tepidisphaeraceae bacterium]|jgi:transcriptional regulator with XRE-family HTH domain